MKLTLFLILVLSTFRISSQIELTNVIVERDSVKIKNIRCEISNNFSFEVQFELLFDSDLQDVNACRLNCFFYQKSNPNSLIPLNLVDYINWDENIIVIQENGKYYVDLPLHLYKTKGLNLDEYFGIVLKLTGNIKIKKSIKEVNSSFGVKWSDK